MRSKLLRQLNTLDERQRAATHLDQLAELHEFALEHIESVPATASAVESALTLLRYSDELRERTDVHALLADLHSYDRTSKVRRRWLGPAAADALENAARSDARAINDWALGALRDVLAISQALHIVDEIGASPRPHRWTLGLPEIAPTEHPDLRNCGVSPLREVLADPPMVDAGVWQPMWAMSPASRRLTSHLRTLGLDHKRAGAFEAVFSDNPDRLSQAANSGVEMLTRTAKELIRSRPEGARWLKSLARATGREPAAGELFRGGVAVQRDRPIDDFEGACDADVVAAECVIGAQRVRNALERLKHNDRGRADDMDQLCRCLVAAEAVMILMTGIVQLRVDNPNVTAELRALNIAELEAYSTETRDLWPLKPILTCAVLSEA